MDKQESVSTSYKELSQIAKESIKFVLDYEPYSCYDAAPRVLAILLRNGIPATDCDILTTANSHHYWVRWESQQFSTTDLSNLRSGPIVDDRCQELITQAKEHLAEADTAFTDWILDSSKVYLHTHEEFVESSIKNPRNVINI